MARFISLEGVEGAGKSTVMTAVEEWAHERAVELVATREPGGCESAEVLRDLLLDPDRSWHPNAELLMMFAARWQHWSEVIEPALRQGKWVISDRYIDASYAYQCGGRGLPTQLVDQLAQQLPSGAYPGLTLLLDLPVEQGLSRARDRGPEDRFEQEQASFFERVRATYLARAKQDPSRIKIVDASKDQSSVRQQVIRILEHQYS